MKYAHTELEVTSSKALGGEAFTRKFDVSRNVALYHLHHGTYPATKFEVATSKRLGGDTFTKKKHYLIFDLDIGVKVTRNVAQYPLYHVTYSATKLEVDPSYR